MSHNQLSEIPLNLPKSLAELRIHDNKVKKIQKETFKGMNALHVLGKFFANKWDILKLYAICRYRDLYHH